ncbi:MAG: hypothetical protein ACOY95_02670 [Pseudomonadota bacterium]
MDADHFNRLISQTQLTPEQVARLCDVTPRTLRRWRSGVVTPPQAAVILLELIKHHGVRMASDLDSPTLAAWLAGLIRDMRGESLCTIQRRLGCGYGVISRALRETGN